MKFNMYIKIYEEYFNSDLLYLVSAWVLNSHWICDPQKVQIAEFVCAA
jgi:hypothetical protein